LGDSLFYVFRELPEKTWYNMPKKFFQAACRLSLLSRLKVVTLQNRRPNAVDKGSFIAEIEACSEMMYRVAWSILRNETDVQDALQDAALKAWEKRDKLRDEKFFRTWITRILINACYDTQRKRRRIVSMDEIPESTVSSAPDPELALALQALPEKLRLPLVLCYSEGMSYEEAADVLRIPITTLRGRLRRGKEELRKELNAE
jgi:RNA polymerase sigma-70 factor (ECF subfamily)